MRILLAKSVLSTGSGPNTRTRIFRLGLFFILAMYFGCSPYLFFAGLEFAPKRFDPLTFPQTTGISREDVSIVTATGTKLSAWYFPVDGAQYSVIIHHGQGENISYKGYYDTALTLREAGASVLLYDYEGFGASEGSPSNQAMSRDALAAYEYLTQHKHASPNSIVHCGISLGTGAASDIASNRPCAGLILLSPYLSVSGMAKHHLRFLTIYPPFMFPQPDLGTAALLRSTVKPVPVLVFQGANDYLIPVSNADEFIRRYAGPKKYIRVDNGYHIGSLAYEPDQQVSGCVGQICRDYLSDLSNEKAH